ncbi:MAG: energy-coupled thiamine transporter ThiT [Clostridia bacterium]|nr:energy-coupled thiamine transporter ThiT [Clostridia bacterium]
MTKTKKITISAIMVAMSTVLAMISKIIPAPWLQGGSITLASMVPVVAVSVILGCRWGVLSAVVYSLIQMMTGFYPPPTQTMLNFFLVIFLDYIAAFGVLGFAGGFYKILGRKKWAIPASGALVSFLRYVCHILSGILIWGVYAEEGQSVLAYSLAYNGSYMIPEIIITAVALAFMAPIIEKLKD